MRSLWAAAFLACAPFGATAKSAPDFQTYITEPKITAVTFNVLENKNVEQQAPGYVFLSPYRGHTGWGPQIFDTAGHLVWWGGDNVRIRAIDLHPCLYNSTEHDHLCYNDAVPYEQGGHSVGLVRFFYNNYTQIGDDFGPMGDLRGPDIHELNTPTASKGQSYLVDIYQIREMDLTPYNGTNPGYVLDGCFQEVDLLSRELIFQWCSLDHTDIDLTYVYLNGAGNYTIPGLAGTGKTRASPWDYFHINSVDKSSEGDYIVSSRHANSILHVAGPNNQKGYQPGQVIWYLGGKLSSFEMPKETNFSVQHTIRYVREKDETGDLQVSLFNNAWEGHTKTAKLSYGMLIGLDTDNMQASLISTFEQPDGLMAHDQGNLQMLPNGNGFVGWGHCNYFSEHAPTGELLYYVQFGGKGDCDDQKPGVNKDNSFFVSSFRAWKFPWKGYPTTSPKLVSFVKECSPNMNVFMSWNGATEVASWAIYGSNSTNSTFTLLRKVEKSGFETKAVVDFSLNVYAKALDRDGNVLRSSRTEKTFVPKEGLACESAKCMNRKGVSKSDSMADSCLYPSKPSHPHKGSNTHQVSDKGNVMTFKFRNFDVGSDILLKICLPFAVVFLLLVFTRNRWLSSCTRFRRGTAGVELKDPF